MGHPLTKYYNGGSEWGTPHKILKWGAVKGTPLMKYTNWGGGRLRGHGHHPTKFINDTGFVKYGRRNICCSEVKGKYFSRT